MKPHAQSFTEPMTVGDLRHVIKQLEFASDDEPIRVKTRMPDGANACFGIIAGRESEVVVAQGHLCPLLERPIVAGSSPCEICPSWVFDPPEPD
jgi:hypothetical protein